MRNPRCTDRGQAEAAAPMHHEPNRSTRKNGRVTLTAYPGCPERPANVQLNAANERAACGRAGP